MSRLLSKYNQLLNEAPSIEDKANSNEVRQLQKTLEDFYVAAADAKGAIGVLHDYVYNIVHSTHKINDVSDLEARKVWQELSKILKEANFEKQYVEYKDLQNDVYRLMNKARGWK